MCSCVRDAWRPSRPSASVRTTWATIRTPRPEYRPGAVLLAYYMVAFSLLLVHYLHDGHYFFRPRDLRGAERVAS